MEIQITGFVELASEFNRRAAEAAAADSDAVVVGYAAPYAVYVHEDLSMNHPRGGQAKFLEQPARQYRGLLQGIVTQVMRSGVKSSQRIRQALLAAGQALHGLSQPLVPVDTGALKASGFVELEAKGTQAYATAHAVWKRVYTRAMNRRAGRRRPKWLISATAERRRKGLLPKKTRKTPRRRKR